MSSMTTPAPPLIAPVAAAIEALVAAVSEGRVRDLSHEQLTGLVVGARREQARLEAVVLAAVAEVDTRGSHVHHGALTTGAWLRQHTRATPAEATATARTARVLRSGTLPGTAAALAAGEITPRHAQVIAQGVTDAPAGAAALIEPEVLHVAREADVRSVATVMRQFAHALDPDDADHAALRRYQRRGLTLSPTLDGTAVISGQADEESGALIATAIDTANPLLTDDRRTPAQRRLDALTDICRRYLADPDSPTRGGGAHPHLIVTTDHTALHPTHPATGTRTGTTGTTGRTGPTGTHRPDPPIPDQPGSPGATLSWIGHITASTARRIGCDATLTTVTIGPHGQVTDTDTEHRYFTPAQRRAMIARDGDRCIWPWCDRPTTWTHGHHLQHWADLGPTTIDNGALPCATHHTHLHEGHWTLHRTPDGRYTATHPDGRTIGPEPHPPGHNRPPPRPPEPDEPPEPSEPPSDP